jgi:hypothetical protein
VKFFPVPGRFKVLAGSMLLSCFLGTAVLNGQILRDSASLNLLKEGVDAIYNFQFDAASAAWRKLRLVYPGHPVVYLMKGMITYWENYPLAPSSEAHIAYENDMLNCIRLCEESNTVSDYPEFLLANLGARGMLLMFYADNDLSNKVFPLAASTYRYIRQSFDYSAVYPDFYFFTGLYNYYREAYPDAHPVYKVIAFLFPKGDRVKGLEEMQRAAENSIMLKAESYFFLTHIYISYENNYMQAYIFSKSLHDLYPNNLHYLSYLIRNLLLIKKYDEAETLMNNKGMETGNPYFEAQLKIFKGILQEKKYKNSGLAKKYYNDALNELSAFGYYGKEYSSYAWFGLSRISDSENDKSNRRIYRKKALDLSSYKMINFDD